MKISRRELLAWFAAAGFSASCARRTKDNYDPAGKRPVFGARARSAFDAPNFALGQASVGCVAFGDTGLGNAITTAVASGVAAKAAVDLVQFALLCGDNFYSHGVASVDDAQWRTRFEYVFSKAVLPFPFYAVLGNHDHEGNTEAQVEYTSKSARWRMPAHYYSFTRALDDRDDVEFFMLDTTPARNGDPAAREQTRWLADKLANSRARWKIAVGHHPLHSGGIHGESKAVIEEFEPLFARHGVDLYVSGHDHDLELLETKAGYLQLVSGTGCSTREMTWSDATLFAASEPGFAWLGFSPDEMWVEMVLTEGGPSFAHRVAKAPRVAKAAIEAR